MHLQEYSTPSWESKKRISAYWVNVWYLATSWQVNLDRRRTVIFDYHNHKWGMWVAGADSSKSKPMDMSCLWVYDCRLDGWGIRLAGFCLLVALRFKPKNLPHNSKIEHHQISGWSGPQFSVWSWIGGHWWHTHIYIYMGASQNRRSGTSSGTTPVPYPRSIPPFHTSLKDPFHTSVPYLCSIPLFHTSVPYLCSIPLIHTLLYI